MLQNQKSFAWHFHITSMSMFAAQDVQLLAGLNLIPGGETIGFVDDFVDLPSVEVKGTRWIGDGRISTASYPLHVTSRSDEGRPISQAAGMIRDDGMDLWIRGLAINRFSIQKWGGQCKRHHGSLFSLRVMCNLNGSMLHHVLIMHCCLTNTQKPGRLWQASRHGENPDQWGSTGQLRTRKEMVDLGAKAFRSSEVTSSHSVLSGIVSPYGQPSCDIIESRM